jgi:hypothetical protein
LKSAKEWTSTIERDSLQHLEHGQHYPWERWVEAIQADAAADMRERAAKVCEEMKVDRPPTPVPGGRWEGGIMGKLDEMAGVITVRVEQCAEAIRALPLENTKVSAWESVGGRGVALRQDDPNKQPTKERGR